MPLVELIAHALKTRAATFLEVVAAFAPYRVRHQPVGNPESGQRRPESDGDKGEQQAKGRVLVDRSARLQPLEQMPAARCRANAFRSV